MPTYLTTTAADALAATLPGLSTYLSASSADKDKALLQASSDVDHAMVYQGRKLDPAQPLQFPRIAYESSVPTPGYSASDTVWSLDPGTGSPIVPDDVKLAVLYQADSVLAAEREARLDRQHDGVAYDQTANLAESYKSTDRPGLTTGLTRRAYQLLLQYRAQSGRIL